MKACTANTLCLALAALFVLNGALSSQASEGNADSQIEYVSASLVADVDAVTPGQPFFIGVRLEMAEGWHVNWINPGDAGLAPAVEWSLPDGFTGRMVEWPHPWRYPAGPLVIFGYDKEVILLRSITPPDEIKPGTALRFGAGVSWLACREVCIPGEATVELRLPVATKPGESSSRSAFAEARDALPVRPMEWEIEGWYKDDYTIVLQLQTYSAAAPINEMFFFPYDQGIIENGARQKLTTLLGTGGAEGAYRLEIERSRTVRSEPDRLTGVIVSPSGWLSIGNTTALAVDIPLLDSPR